MPLLTATRRIRRHCSNHSRPSKTACFWPPDREKRLRMLSYGERRLHAAPLPWPRTGPGKALDGKPKFDLAKFEPAYFDRLRSRVHAAGDRGIYVSVMLFGGYQEAGPNWTGNPCHRDNNVNG